MSASFPGENLSLARSDSSGPPLSQHVNLMVQVSCQHSCYPSSSIKALFFNVLAKSRQVHRFERNEPAA